MTTLIILIVLVAIGLYLTTKWDYVILGGIMCIIFGLCLLMHSIAFFTVEYGYGLFVENVMLLNRRLTKQEKTGMNMKLLQS